VTVDLSVVVPVYGCRDCLRALHERLVKSVERVTSSYELVFVDDASPDGAWQILAELAARDPGVRAFRLSRNFGQHAAITAGLTRARGRFVVVMDCDLEEPPEEIPRLYAKAQEGYDIVHTRRTGRRHAWTRRLAGRAYFRARNFFLETSTGTDQGTLSILSRKVVDAFLSLRDRDREYLIALDWLGFRHATIEFEHAQRPEGRSSYTWRGLTRVAVDGLFFQTTVLLRWIVFLGFLIALAGFVLAAYYVITYFTSDPPSGYTSIAVLLVLLSGFIIASMGVIGLYVGKIFEQVKGRPLFLVDTEAGGGTAPSADDVRPLGEPVAERSPREVARSE
jgi:glycosyltransferase involved in cell wall biosynthesis